MDWNKFARDVHEVAVKNGLWDKPRTFDDIVCECLVHLGRAYEEYRSGRPNLYHLCVASGDKRNPCDWDLGKPCPLATGELACEHRDRKPHGAAAELGECVLGLLDYMGKENVDLGEMSSEGLGCEALVSFPVFIVRLVTILAASRECVGEARYTYLVAEILCVFEWARQNNIDMESILRELHECEKARACAAGREATSS